MVKAASREIEALVDRGKREGRSFRQSLKKELPFAIGSASLIWQILFFYLPLFLLFSSAFTKFSSTGKLQGLTLENFGAICSPVYAKIILSSLSLAATTVIFCLIIGFPLAYHLAFHLRRSKNLFLFLLILPFWTNFLLHIYAWFFVLEKHGFINNLLLHFGLLSEPIHFLNSHFAITLMMVYYYLPFMVMPLFSALEKFDLSLLEASLDLGANRRQTFIRVLLPLVTGAIRAGVFLVFIPAFGEFVIPELMGGDKYFFVGNVISLSVLGEKTLSIGMAFTVLATLSLFIICYFVNKLISKAPSILLRLGGPLC